MSETFMQRWGSQILVGVFVLLLLLPLTKMGFKTYLTLTIAGCAMGMMLFLIASGLSIIFGLMDVINFAHGACFAFGAYAGFSTFNVLHGWVEANSWLLNLGVFMCAIFAAMIVGALLGILLERFIIRYVYGSHLFQILITFGASVVLVEIIKIIWGPNDEVMAVPLNFQNYWDMFDVIVLRYPVITIFLGLIVYGLIQTILKKTKIGKIVRAGVEDPEMVQAMGHNIFLIFTGVFATGVAFAAMGGLTISIFSRSVYPEMGGWYLIFAFIVVIIGGLGSITGSLVGALIVGLAYNYVAYIIPWAAAGVNILIMVIILLIRPTGLFAAGK
jgi:branched-chain amino acid transport system permease protein